MSISDAKTTVVIAKGPVQTWAYESSVAHGALI